MPSILIVEDEPSIADNLRFAFVREGYEVVICGIAAEGISALGGRTFDLVILDVGLPDKNGFEACKDIRAFSDVPVIFLTARGDEIDRVVGLEIGADDYVLKPFSVRELIARVRVILRRRHAAAAVPVAAPPAGFVLDAEAARVTFRGQVLDLTRYEFLVLKLLLEHPGRVYSRAGIMEMLWPANSGSSDRTVDAHIKTLRAKLKVIAPGEEPIQTHRGFGYSLATAR